MENTSGWSSTRLINHEVILVFHDKRTFIGKTGRVPCQCHMHAVADFHGVESAATLFDGHLL